MTEAEFLALLSPLEAYLFRMALAITGNSHDAQDALQEAVLSAYVSRDQLRDKQYFKAWIKTIVAHQCGSAIRGRGRVVPMGRGEEFSQNSARADQGLIWNLVEELPQSHAQIIILRYAADLKQAEIAETLDVPVGTVKSRLHYALKRLRAQIEGKEGGKNEMPGC